MIGTGRAAILAPLTPRDAAERAAAEIRDELVDVLPYSGFVPEILPQHATAEDAARLIEVSELVIFAGHAWTGIDSSGIDLQHFVLTSKELEKISWTGKLVLLVGCETAAVGSGNHDIAETLLRNGARAVAGTTSEVDAAHALRFVTSLLQYAMSGEAIDYAFFAARREMAVAETLLSIGIAWDKAIETAERVSREDIASDFESMLGRAGLSWDQAFSAAVFSLSWTLFGGASERLR
nr:CHAT domain-containing protein [Burkholderia vietnamiensis]